MGNNTQEVYNQEMPNTKTPGFTATYRRKGVQELKCTPDQKITNLSDLLEMSKEKYGNTNCLGEIMVQKQKDKEGNEIETRSIKAHTYNQVYQTAHNLGKVLHSKEYYYQEAVRGMKLVGIYAKNRYEWFISDWACIQFGLTIVPFYDTLGVQNLSYCLHQTLLTTLFVTAATAKILMTLKDVGHLRRLITFDKLDEQTAKKTKAVNLQVLDFQQLLKLGSQIKHIPHGHIHIPIDQIFTFSYTSGTTGPPKGALMSHGNFLSFLASVDSHKQIHSDSSDRHLSYLPLPHLMERCLSLFNFYSGAYVIISSGNILKLKEDYMIAKPTILVSVPRVLNRIAENVRAKFASETGYNKCLIDRAVGSKMQSTKDNGSYTHALYDKLIFSKVRETFGGNVRLIASGSAPINPEVQAFLKIIFCCPYVEVYGQTENTAAVVLGRGEDVNLGSMSQFGSGVEVRLADIPQMKYTSEDRDSEGKPCPRGQIWVRGPQVFKGYYKQDEVTKETITEDGWLKSGDVGQINSQRLSLKIIDRKKNLFKLAQGQYIAPDKVENVYMKSNLISQIFLHGQPAESFAVAIATPNKDNFIHLATTKNLSGSFEQLCRNKQMRTLLLTQLNSLGRKEGLTGFEVAKNIHLDAQGFLSRKILTNTMKLIRFEARQCYKGDIQNMYKEGELPLK